MIWILVALNLSSWDGEVKSRVEIGEFTSQQDCISEREMLIKREGSGAVHFVCAEKSSTKETDKGKN